MDNRKIARILMLAGGMAALGVLFVLFVWGVDKISSLALLFRILVGLPYLAALYNYFRISQNIGRDRSFCRENVTRMGGIVRCLGAAALIWLVALAASLLGAQLVVSLPRFYACAAMLLALCVTLAVTLVAWAMERLVDRAVRLQEDSELTI